MIIFLYGPDNYRLKQGSDLVVSSFNKKYKNTISVSSFNFDEDVNYDQLESSLKSLSFFKEPRLVIVRNVLKDKKYCSRIVDILTKNKLAEDKEIIVLFLEYLKDSEAKKACPELYKILENSAKPIKYFDFLNDEKLRTWIKNEIKIRDNKIENSAINFLINNIGNDSYALINEIEKLCNYKKGEPITIDDARELISQKIDLNIFDLVEALSLGSRSRAYDLLYSELTNGRDPFYLLSMFVYQFRNMIVVKDLIDRGLSAKEIAKKASLHPFVVTKTMRAVKGAEMSILKKDYAKLHEIDINSKLGKVDLADSLFNFVLSKNEPTR